MEKANQEITEEKHIRVLFLDVDGVLNSASTFKSQRGMLVLDPMMCFMVGKIQLDTDCEVVLSSSWRHWPEGKAEVDKRVVKLHSITPARADGFRGKEIKSWLKKHPEVEKYAILDDESDFLPDQPLFKTDWETGLTEEIAKAVTEYLNS